MGVCLKQEEIEVEEEDLDVGVFHIYLGILYQFL